MKKLKTITALLLATVMLAACGGSENKKKISIAYANWSEGIAMTNLAKVIFEDQGYEVKLLNADLAPIFASLSRKKAEDRKSTRLNSSHIEESRMPSSA